ncbi:MAG: hypothetical protein LC687_04170 [Actinobacteria bacterium]|nr:hypothetical protein [Actinomycetota bacterium]MCA1807031.1 hypothetical protein [Actinomycetota bacterium]
MNDSPDPYDLQRQVHSVNADVTLIRADLDKIKEKIISLSAEYINDKTWVHNSLRNTLDSLDKVLDRLSRLEGKMDNGINKTISELKESVTYLNQESRELVSRADLAKIEGKLETRIKEDHGDLTSNMKTEKEWRYKNVLIIMAVIGQIFTLAGVIIAIIQLT